MFVLFCFHFCGLFISFRSIRAVRKMLSIDSTLNMKGNDEMIDKDTRMQNNFNTNKYIYTHTRIIPGTSNSVSWVKPFTYYN